MSLKIVVLAKQVPDTRCVGKDAMNADGTIQPCGPSGHFQSGRPQCAGAGATSERRTSGIDRHHAHHGTRTCSRNHSRRTLSWC